MSFSRDRLKLSTSHHLATTKRHASMCHMDSWNCLSRMISYCLPFCFKYFFLFSCTFFFSLWIFFFFFLFFYCLFVLYAFLPRHFSLLFPVPWMLFLYVLCPTASCLSHYYSNNNITCFREGYPVSSIWNRILLHPITSTELIWKSSLYT